MPRTLMTTGACSVAGGAAWVAACLAQNTLPQGCIGDACATHPMRGSSATATALGALALLLVVVASAGMLVLARRRGATGLPAALGAGAGVLGVALLGAAGIVAAIDDMWSGMPALVVPGVLLLTVGLMVLAWTVLRAGVLPRWTALLVLAGAVLLLLANEQTSRVLWAAPFGVTWMVAGVVLLRSRPQAHLLPSGAAIPGNS